MTFIKTPNNLSFSVTTQNAQIGTKNIDETNQHHFTEEMLTEVKGLLNSQRKSAVVFEDCVRESVLDPFGCREFII